MSPGVQAPARSLPRRLASGAFRLIALGLVTAPVGVAAVTLSGMENKAADLIAQFTAPAFAGALMLAAGFLLIQTWRWALAALAAAGLLLLALQPQWAPDGPRPAEGAEVVRLYSANVHYLNGDVEALSRSVAEADADIVILIELGAEAVGRVDEILARYPHRSASVRLDSTRGPSRTVIASRRPLGTMSDPADGLHAVAARAETSLGPMTVVGAHLTRPWPFVNPWGQISQTMALTRLLAPVEGPILVAGDFNSVSSGRIGRQIRTDIDLHPAPTRLGTWPSDLPAWMGIAIDQVYASDDLSFVSRRLGRDNGSDHRPVITEITRAAE